MSETQIHRNEDWLRQKRRIENKTKREIANLAECGRTTIDRWLNRYNIICRRNDPDLIEELYCEENMSSREIAEKFNCGKSSILRTMREHNIERNKPNREKPPQYVCHTDGRGYMIFRHNDNVVYEHRLLAVAEFGIDDVREKQVHHKNEIKWDNRPENIELMSAEKHTRHHKTQQ